MFFHHPDRVSLFRVCSQALHHVIICRSRTIRCGATQAWLHRDPVVRRYARRYGHVVRYGSIGIGPGDVVTLVVQLGVTNLRPGVKGWPAAVCRARRYRRRADHSLSLSAPPKS
eukprot:735916-Hanusia_phi.AAC.1